VVRTTGVLTLQGRHLEGDWHLGMSMPAASHACSTVEPLGMFTGSSFTNTSIVSGAGAGSACRAGAVACRLRLLPPAALQ
jgi:hypothetical protein